MMADFMEQGLLLDPAKADTDGDGLLDGNDRNPLCAPGTPDPDTDDIARFLLYLHTRYGHNSMGPYSDKIWIVSTTAVRDGAVVPSMFHGIEFRGMDGDERRFSFYEYVAPLGAVWYEIRMKCFDGVWLPVKRKVTMIS